MRIQLTALSVAAAIVVTRALFGLPSLASSTLAPGTGNTFALPIPGWTTIAKNPEQAQVQSIGLPVRLQIPSLKVDAAVEYVGETADGAMDVPRQWQNVGWYEPGTRPGAVGNAVMAGHLDSDNGPAVFWTLKTIKTGAEMIVTDDKGADRTFVVRKAVKYEDAKVPMNDIFGTSTGSHLNLITCGGTWDEVNHVYSKRFVVYGDLQN